MDNKRLQEIKERTLKSTDGTIYEIEDDDYYEGGAYIGTGPYFRNDNGDIIEGIAPHGIRQKLHHAICRMEESKNKENDMNLFVNARQDILDLITYIEELQKQKNISAVLKKLVSILVSISWIQQYTPKCNYRQSSNKNMQIVTIKHILLDSKSSGSINDNY